MQPRSLLAAHVVVKNNRQVLVNCPNYKLLGHYNLVAENVKGCGLMSPGAARVSPSLSRRTTASPRCFCAALNHRDAAEPAHCRQVEASSL